MAGFMPDTVTLVWRLDGLVDMTRNQGSCLHHYCGVSRVREHDTQHAFISIMVIRVSEHDTKYTLHVVAISSVITGILIIFFFFLFFSFSLFRF